MPNRFEADTPRFVITKVVDLTGVVRNDGSGMELPIIFIAKGYIPLQAEDTDVRC